MKRFVYITTILSVMTIFWSCKNSTSSSSVEGTKMEMHYSDLLTLTECEGYTYAEIADPWDSTHVLHRYILIDKEAKVPSNLPEGDIVRIPLDKAVVYTSVHSSLIDQLGAVEKIKGVCDLKYIKVPYIQNGVKNGNVADLGEGTNPNIESIIDLEPDAILLSPFQNSGTYGKLGKLGIPLIECADYMETSALGRAEWMKFYGLLVGKAYEADTTFTGLENRYNTLKELANTSHPFSSGERARGKGLYPTVITDLKFGGTWYVPGGKSTIGRLLADAGANYIYAETTESGSIPLAPEAVFDKAIDADLWIIKYNQATDKTYEEIAQEYANYSNMKAFKERNVYACNTGKVPFYEDVPFHPDHLLKDYIKIFHPECLPNYELKFYKKLMFNQ